MQDKPSREGSTQPTEPPEAAPLSSGPVPEPLAVALRAVDASPSRIELWDEAEGLVAKFQRASELAGLYRTTLAKPLPREVALELGERAVQFHSEWLDEPGLIIDVLDRVLAIDPTAEWAFARLSVLLTAAERWDQLLALYDRVLEATTDEKARVGLLQEAAQAARDFAGQSGRAIGYFEQLHALRPGDAQTAAALERLLERDKRWPDLIRLWTSRLGDLAPEAARAARLRIAACWLEQLGDAGAALDVAAPLVAEAPDQTQPVALVERILASAETPEPVRARALASLKEHHGRKGAPDEVVRVLGVALGYAPPAAQPPLLREIAARLRRQRKLADALPHYAALVGLQPGSAPARAKLRNATERTARHDLYAEALASAAEGSSDVALRIALQMEAAAVRAERLADPAGAVDLYRRAADAPEADAGTVLAAARRLRELYALLERAPELLDVLERLATLEEEESARREVLGEAARLADERGDADRALAAWRCRLEIDAADPEALDAVVAILERGERHLPLIDALRARAGATSDPDRRKADLVRVATIFGETLDDVAQATAAWLAVEGEFGPHGDTVDALAELLPRGERWDDLAALLGRALAIESDSPADDPARRVRLLCQLGDTLRERLGKPASALEHYCEALRERPRHPAVRRGLEALLRQPECAAAAVQALVEACAATDDVAGTLALLEHRLATAEDTTARTRVLAETAHLQEQRAGDAVGALSSIRRAFGISPTDAALETELIRLAEATQGWSVAAAAYADAFATARDGERRAELELSRAAILEHHLDDASGSLDGYLRVIALTPANLAAAEAAVRVAAALGSWDVAARALLASSAAHGEVPATVISAMQEAASSSGAWDRAADALSWEVAEAGDLPAALARDLETHVAIWHRDRRSDPEAAARTLLALHSRVGTSLETLRMLAALQRRAPSRPLVETLLELADAETDALDVLHEAVEITVSVVKDRVLGRTILERLLSQASTSWVSEEHSDAPRLEWYATWALDHLVRDAIAHSDPARAIELLVEGAWFPFIKGKARGMILQAAAIAANDLGDADRAIELYKGLLERASDDAVAIERLGALYERTGRSAQLLALRRHELTGQPTPPPVSRRLPLRLQIAELLSREGDDDGQLQMLRDNLADEAGHAASLDQAAVVLEGAGRSRELLDLLCEQALALEASLDRARAQELWLRAAKVAEETIGDVERALDAQRRALDISDSAESLEALARLHASRGEHEQAVGFLERRLKLAYPAPDSAVLARLARAQLGAGQRDRARATLERGVEKDASATELRDLLAELYRSSEAWEPLAALLRTGAGRVADPAVKLAYLREAADVLFTVLGRPVDAIPVLEGAVALAPDDRPARLRLAEALVAGARLDEALALLLDVAEEFGKRRSKERADVHYRIAAVAKAHGDSAEAIRQLEIAAGMDVEHPGICRMLGELQRDAGDLDRAERSFRTLLLLAKRRTPGEDGAPAPAGAGTSSVLLELHRIARLRGREERATELLESAFEAAGQDEAEALVLEQALRQAGDRALLLRALEARRARMASSGNATPLLAEMADLLDASDDPGAAVRAFEARLEALAGAPDSIALHDATRASASRSRQGQRYADLLEKLAGQALAASKKEVGHMLLLRLGDIYERDLGELDRARAAYARAEECGADSIEVWRAALRVATASNDVPGQIRALRRLVVAHGNELEGATQNEDLYQLADLELRAPTTVERGIETLGAALDRDPQYERATAMVQRAVDTMPLDAALLALYERVARASGEAATLLDALERGARLRRASLEPLREAVEIALSLGEGERAERLLLRAVEIASLDSGGPAAGAWALVALAERREVAGDLKGAVEWMKQAADVVEPADAFDLSLRIAALAAGPIDDLPLAAQTYEKLLERDPSDRAAWEPLLDVYRRMGAHEALEARLAATGDLVLDADERNHLRTERARLLLARPDRQEDGVIALREILDENPDNEEASDMLLELCERTGRADVVTDVLGQRLEAARERGDASAVATISLRLGALVAPTRRELALDVYRSAVEWAPERREIIDALLALLDPDEDAHERGDLMERLLALESGDEAATLALDLADLRERLGDEPSALTALTEGFRICPHDARVRTRLGRWYADHGNWAPLAELTLEGAAVAGDPDTAVERFREAAALYRDKLGDPRSAAQALLEALARRPADLALLHEYVACLGPGDEAAAIAQIGAALDHAEAMPGDRVELLRLRAELRTRAGRHDEALHDLEEAFAFWEESTVPSPIAPDLARALDQRRARAAAAGDRAQERIATLRLVEVLLHVGEERRARDILGDWTQRSPDDTAALGSLLQMELRAERWDVVARAAARLVPLLQGAAKIDAVLHLADACAKTGRPEEAKSGLEAALSTDPSNARIRGHLRALYEQLGDYRALAALCIANAADLTEPDARFEELMKAGELLLRSAGDAGAAILPLEDARQLKPRDQNAIILLADAYVASERLDQATAVLEAAIAAHKGRRSRELAALHHRMSRVALASGDPISEARWLELAIDSDNKNGEVASELALVATELGQFDAALKALRVLSQLKTPATISRAEAYLRQGQIHHRQGDSRRAVLMAKRALAEDPTLHDAEAFLAQIGKP